MLAHHLLTIIFISEGDGKSLIRAGLHHHTHDRSLQFVVFVVESVKWWHRYIIPVLGDGRTTSGLKVKWWWQRRHIIPVLRDGRTTSGFKVKWWRRRHVIPVLEDGRTTSGFKVKWQWRRRLMIISVFRDGRTTSALKVLWCYRVQLNKPSAHPPSMGFLLP